MKQSQQYELNLSDYEMGVLIGLLVGEGTFGGDGKQAHVSLRMHTRHERLFQWLQKKVPGGRLYGPYHHGGRSYYQWMVRGHALRYGVLPLLEEQLEQLDAYASQRFQEMKEKYGL